MTERASLWRRAGRLFSPRVVAAAVAAMAVLGPAPPGAAQPQSSPHVRVSAGAAFQTLAPGASVRLLIRQSIEPGWHTYWRNSGDAGQPALVTWSTPKGVAIEGPDWPAPQRMPEGPLMTYGFTDAVTLLFTARAAADATPGPALLKARIDVLVCRDICIPETAEVAIPIAIDAGRPRPDPVWRQAAAVAEAGLPRGGIVEARYRKDGTTLRFGVVGAAIRGLPADGAYLFPAEPGVIAHAATQKILKGPGGLTIAAPAADAFVPGKPVPAVLVVAGRAFDLRAAPGPLPVGASGSGEARPARAGPPAEHGSGPSWLRLGASALLAFLGGLALNLMPCVFPVLAMKAASLSRGGGDPGHARREGAAFAAGAVASMLALALVLIGLKAAGQGVGWGFQLQSPAMTAGLTLLLLAVALNLSGVFSVGESLQAAASGPARPGLRGAFLTGVLAVVVGAPCTAPFMGAAMGYALGAGPISTLLVFVALGMGLSAPFLAVSASSRLIRLMPRPGPWTQELQRLLAFPMYGAAAFMAWVFARQAAAGAQGLLLAATVMLALSLHLYGRSQQRRLESRGGLVRLVAAGVALSAALASALIAATAPQPAAEAGSDGLRGAALDFRPWSPEAVEAARQSGKPVFVNFTAAWCVTCKVNEAVAFRDPVVARAVARTGAVLFEADWTRPDARIATALAERGRSGVPLYLVFGRGTEPEVLPQILTGARVAEALDRASITPAVAAARR